MTSVLAFRLPYIPRAEFPMFPGPARSSEMQDLPEQRCLQAEDFFALLAIMPPDPGPGAPDTPPNLPKSSPRGAIPPSHRPQESDLEEAITQPEFPEPGSEESQEPSPAGLSLSLSLPRVTLFCLCPSQMMSHHRIPGDVLGVLTCSSPGASAAPYLLPDITASPCSPSVSPAAPSHACSQKTFGHPTFSRGPDRNCPDCRLFDAAAES